VIYNIDLISHEIYFTKQDSLVYLEPTIFFSYQTVKPESSNGIRSVIESSISDLNQNSRVQLSLEQPQRLTTEPVKFKSTQMTRLRRSLLFIADVSPIIEMMVEGELQQIPSPQVCVEIGYGIQAKRPEQILLIQMQENPNQGIFPFDLPIFQRLTFKDQKSLAKQLPEIIATHLQKFKLNN